MRCPEGAKEISPRRVCEPRDRSNFQMSPGRAAETSCRPSRARPRLMGNPGLASAPGANLLPPSGVLHKATCSAGGSLLSQGSRHGFSCSAPSGLHHLIWRHQQVIWDTLNQAPSGSGLEWLRGGLGPDSVGCASEKIPKSHLRPHSRPPRVMKHAAPMTLVACTDALRLT